MRTVLDVDIMNEGSPQRATMKKLAVRWAIVAVVIGAICTAVFYLLTDAELGWFWSAVPVLVGYLVALPVHELIHGAAFKLLGPQGTKVRFGMAAGFLYATCPGVQFSRGRITVVLLAPFVVLSCVFAAFGACGWTLWGLVWAPNAALWLGVLHAAGCVGDFWFVHLIRTHPEADLCEDTDRGIKLLASA